MKTMESEVSAPADTSQTLPSILTPKFWNYFSVSNDKQCLLEHFYRSLKKLTVIDYDDTVINNIQQIYKILMDHRKYYREHYSKAMKEGEIKVEELKAAKSAADASKKQNEAEKAEIRKGYEEQLFEAEEALSKLKKQLKEVEDVKEEKQITIEAMAEKFKNDMNKLFELEDSYEQLKQELTEAKEQKQAQIELNQSINAKMEELKNELSNAKKKIQENEAEKTSVNKLLEKAKTVEEKNNLEKKSKDERIAKLEAQIDQLNVQKEIDIKSIEEWKTKAKSSDELFKEQKTLVEKLKSEVEEKEAEFQKQIEIAAAIQKELMFLKSEIEAQQEGKCEIQILPNRKRASPVEDGNDKSPKQKAVNQENQLPSLGSPPLLPQSVPSLDVQKLPNPFQQQLQHQLQQLQNGNNFKVTTQQNMPCQNRELQQPQIQQLPHVDPSRVQKGVQQHLHQQQIPPQQRQPLLYKHMQQFENGMNPQQQQHEAFLHAQNIPYTSAQLGSRQHFEQIQNIPPAYPQQQQQQYLPQIPYPMPQSSSSNPYANFQRQQHTNPAAAQNMQSQAHQYLYQQYFSSFAGYSNFNF